MVRAAPFSYSCTSPGGCTTNEPGVTATVSFGVRMVPPPEKQK